MGNLIFDLALHLPTEASIAAGFAAVQGKPIGGFSGSSAPSALPSLFCFAFPPLKSTHTHSNFSLKFDKTSLNTRDK
jgi:hypothetical protein